ncbi:transporter, small conductance mechanosensitive ion channel MscS family protein [Aeromicrobium marinum DSM 15272]|uniref:Transporter, small conductance mechanosensitive ion channel MscS family protein n=1 Tax=Aeromicrobium marinum DSM 15272 TaxID=585531 RepID=E2SBB8_9ACTN|nr:mechanosensitive ion channel family protein [Aeromicrobium marinum]EFQ83664.1 transporter, small conductance mechanosensitive ion channel MscS family protein [Aeromicrobium marinum DSM 15272]
MPDLDLQLPEGRAFEYLVERPSGVLLIVVLALVLRWLVRRAIGRVVRRAGAGSVPGATPRSKAGEFLADLRPGASQRRQQRATAIGDLLTSIASILIAGIAFVMILDQLGVNIAPLLTGAGILGVALGFGAQTLVKDFLAGIFMILEDQYGVGDVIDMGEASGTVEAVGLRITRLRDVNGTVWYVRNGEVVRVGNQSQTWARTVLDITVSYDADLDVVQQILAEEAHAVYTDEKFSEVVLEEPEVWGVERFDSDGAVVRVVLKTAPLQQWAVARAMRQRIKYRFDEAGIEIPSLFRARVEESSE